MQEESEFRECWDSMQAVLLGSMEEPGGSVTGRGLFSDSQSWGMRRTLVKKALSQVLIWQVCDGCP